MTFPWEIDYNKHRTRHYQRKQMSMAHRRMKNYQTSGHPIWYPQYLQTEHWQQFKARYRKSGRLRACVICGDQRYELHHVTYERVGQECLDDVVALCRRHHARAHKREKQGVDLKIVHL